MTATGGGPDQCALQQAKGEKEQGPKGIRRRCWANAKCGYADVREFRNHRGRQEEDSETNLSRLTVGDLSHRCRLTDRGSAARRMAGPIDREGLWPKTTRNRLK